MTAKRDNPLQLRVTREERAEIKRLAGLYRLSVNAYLKWRALHHDQPPPRSRTRQPVENQQYLIQALAKLGASRVSSNLNQLCQALNSGTLVVMPETEALIRQVCHELLEILRLIRKALGFHEDQS